MGQLLRQSLKIEDKICTAVRAVLRNMSVAMMSSPNRWSIQDQAEAEAGGASSLRSSTRRHCFIIHWYPSVAAQTRAIMLAPPLKSMLSSWSLALALHKAFDLFLFLRRQARGHGLSVRRRRPLYLRQRNWTESLLKIGQDWWNKTVGSLAELSSSVGFALRPSIGFPCQSVRYVERQASRSQL